MSDSLPRVHPTADVVSAELGDGVVVWQYAHVRERAVVGDNSVIGRGVYVGPGVVIGSNSKIQNYALVYEPAVLGDGVFVGPAVVFTNDEFPRAITPDGQLKSTSDWQAVGVTVRNGASIGAQSVCVAPVTIGAWALVGSGSTVIHDVPDFALMVGSPARRIGWVGRAGHRLVEDSPGEWVCPETAARYRLVSPEVLAELR